MTCTADRLGPSASRLARLPLVHQLRQSVGLQRGMLVTGLVHHRRSSC